MTQPPNTPPTTDKNTSVEEVMANVESLDSLTPAQLADVLNKLAEKVISEPLEYKIGFGLEQLTAEMMDGIDTSTPEGRKKLAAILRMLAQLVMSREKSKYMAGLSSDLSMDDGRNKPRGR